MTEPLPSVVRAADGDAEDVAGLYLSAREALMSHLPRLRISDETRWWIANVVVPEHQVHLLRAGPGGKLLGLAAVRGARLEHPYVAPAHQGRGHGSQLLHHVIAQLDGELLLRDLQRDDRGGRRTRPDLPPAVADRILTREHATTHLSTRRRRSRGRRFCHSFHLLGIERLHQTRHETITEAASNKLLVFVQQSPSVPKVGR